ncbi:LysM domain-containing protein [Colletotrichum sp. SAR 10_86]|nr:LysM domain-containing protein [Colletotrichum sp. SAR 10_86]
MKFGISLTDFVFLNPAINENCTNLYAEESYCVQAVGDSLGNVSDTACAFQKGFRYCGQWYDALKPSEPDEEIDPMDSAYPGRDGTIETCTEIVDVDEDGYPSCQDILSDYELTIAEFYAWNPSVGADCSGMWADIEDPTPTTTVVSSITAPTASSKPTPPGPTHAGQPDNCNKWHVVKSGDDCSTIESQYALTHAEFLAFNPAVSEDCLSNFWGDYAYCVGTDSSGGSEPVTTTLSSAAASTPTNGPVAAPEPNQAGNAVTSCNKYAQAQSGDWCAAFVERHSLAAADFYSWNTVLGSTGENCGGSFWAEYWYCIGVAP